MASSSSDPMNSSKSRFSGSKVLGAAYDGHGDESFFVTAVLPWILAAAEIPKRPYGHQRVHAADADDSPEGDLSVRGKSRWRCPESVVPFARSRNPIPLSS